MDRMSEGGLRGLDRVSWIFWSPGGPLGFVQSPILVCCRQSHAKASSQEEDRKYHTHAIEHTNTTPTLTSSILPRRL